MRSLGCMADSQKRSGRLTMSETWKAFREKSWLPSHFIYEVQAVYSEEAEAALKNAPEGLPPSFYKKVLRPADHSALPVWACDHEHPTWEDAVSCEQTPLTDEPDSR